MPTAGEPTITTSPPLRFLGDSGLMAAQPPFAEAELAALSAGSPDLAELPAGSPGLAARIAELERAMEEHGGIGIAAPQIGWWARAFCFGIRGTNPRYPAAEPIPFQTWLNPEVRWSSQETNWMWEGCLSVPGMRGWVERPRSVVLGGRGTDGASKEVRLDGLAARVAQHELDHLDGVLFTARVPGTEFILPHASVEGREGWPAAWPSAGSRRTGLGELCDER